MRCGLHAGPAERRDNDFFGSAVNRAARIANSAHGGQVLLSQAVAALVANRLPRQASRCATWAQVRLRDLASPERIYQVMHPQLREKFPALRTLEATPNNLAQQLTSFVGRKRELDEVRALLRNTRLLTLSGAGGIGKTRLSQQLAAEVLDDFPDGVWFVELAPLSDPRLVPQSVAFVLGVKEEAGHPVVEALVKYAKDRRLLLVLDNCEHLVQACAELATQLLQSGPHVKILASSREHLRVAGETSYPVPALAVPDPGKTVASGRTDAIRGGTAVHRSRDGRAAVVPAYGPERRRRRRHLPAAGRNSAGHRTRRRARAHAVGGDRSRRAWAIASACLREGTAPRCRGSKRCAR